MTIRDDEWDQAMIDAWADKQIAAVHIMSARQCRHLLRYLAVELARTAAGRELWAELQFNATDD